MNGNNNIPLTSFSLYSKTSTMAISNKRVVSYLDETYKNKLKELCSIREAKEAVIIREILKSHLDLNDKYTIKGNKTGK